MTPKFVVCSSFTMIKMTSGIWLHEDCVEDSVVDDQGREHLCPFRLDISCNIIDFHNTFCISRHIKLFLTRSNSGYTVLIAL